MKELHMDVETFSTVDLKKCGLYRYAEEAQVMLFAYAYYFLYGELRSEVEVIDLALGESIPAEVIADMYDPSVLKFAHNATFERVILRECLGIDVPINQWRCTAVWAAYLGLPRSLDPLSEVLNLGTSAKLKTGRALIRKFCVPRKPTKKNSATRLYPADDLVAWAEFKEYNRMDVVAEMAAHEKMRRWAVPDSEWAMYHRDQRINDRGIKVDLKLVRNAIALAAKEREQLMARAREITNLENPNSRDQLIRWLEDEGVFTQTLRKADVIQIIGSTTNEVVQELMTIRQQLAKASVKKYEAVARSVCKDGRVRGTLLFYGAGTGRWSGAILQPQNMPSKGLLSPEMIGVMRDVLLDQPDFIPVLYDDDVAVVLSSLLRPMLVPSKGKRFAVADFSAIEGRIVAWLAHEQWRIDLFTKGGKLYETSAEMTFKLPPGSVKKGDPYRDKGKVTELALGYQGWEGALIQMGALEMGIPLEELAPLAKAWREASPAIEAWWYACEKAAIKAIKLKTRVPVLTDYQKETLVSYYYDGHFLRCQLPNGRELFYAKPRVEKNSRGKDSISFWGVDSTTKRWAKSWLYGGLLLENQAQAIARDALVESIQGFDTDEDPVVFHVHDELIAEVDSEWAKQKLDSMLEVMRKPLPWWPELLLKGDGYLTDYYVKED